MILARLEPGDFSDRRYSPRRRLNLGADGSTQAVPDVEVVVHDLSVTGLLIEAAVDLQIGDQLTVEIPGPGTVEAVVVWKSGLYFGCEFVRPIPKTAVSAAALRSMPAPRLSDDVVSPPPDLPSLAGDDLPEDELSPRGKLLTLLGLSLAAWATIAVVVWLILALVWG